MLDVAAVNRHFLGIDLSSHAIHAALVAGDGSLLTRCTAPLETGNLGAQIAAVAAQINPGSDLAGVGVAVPGLVNHITNRVEFSGDLPEATHEGFYSELQEAFAVPVTLENDANAAAYGEYFCGAGRGCHDMFYAMIGAGVGGALILSGELWRGTSGYAGEFGHVTLNAEDDTTLEMMASAAGIVRRTRNRLAQDATSSLSLLGETEEFSAYDVARAAREEGDDFALMMMERTGKFVGAAIAGVINLLNVERIAIGGTLTDAAGDTLLEPVRREAERLAFGPYFATTKIVAAELGADAVMLGAALLARAALAARNGA